MARPFIGAWPGSRTPADAPTTDHAEFLRMQTVAGHTFDFERTRGGRGKMDTAIIKNQAVLDSAAAGIKQSLELNCRVGTTGSIAAVPFTEISAGLWDDDIRAMIHGGTLPHTPSVTITTFKLDNLVGTGHTFEFHSEANIQQAPGQPQPVSGTAAEYKAAYAHVHALFLAEGVTLGLGGKLWFTTSLTRSVFDNGTWTQWLPSDLSTLDVLGSDGYNHPTSLPSTPIRSYEEIFDLPLASAISIGKPFGVFETATEEATAAGSLAGVDPNYKADWFTDAWAWLKTQERGQFYVANWSLDYTQPLSTSAGFETSAPAQAAFIAGWNDYVGTAVTADSYGIAFDGSTDVRAALQTAINAQPPGTVFTLHPGGKYLTSPTTPIQITAPGVTVDGQGASIFRNERRVTDTAGEDIIQLRVNDLTIRNLRVVGFRKDVYLGSTLTPIVGSPTVVGSTMALTAAGDEVRLPLVGLDQVGNPKVSTNFETPFYFRQVDGLCKFEASLSSTAGSGAALFCIYDDDTNTLLRSQSFDPTGGAPQTYTITFDPTPTHLGKRFRITIKKVVAGGTLTVHSITPYGECGFRRGDTPWFNGGNEFADGIQIGSPVGTNILISGLLIEDCEIEGPDGDGVNCAKRDQGTIIRRVTVRGNGRQAYTFHQSIDYLLEDCLGREVGRSGIDFEPNVVTDSMTNGTVRRCDFLNVRNYAFAMRHWAKIIGVTISDITTTNCGMGPLSGGGRPMTVTNFVHTNTYRNEADQIANGGYAGADFILFGGGCTLDEITTELGFRLPDIQNKYNGGSGIITYHPSDMHVTNGHVTNPYTDPFVVIEPTVLNSTVEATGPSTAPHIAVWDDMLVVWDDMDHVWDEGADVGPPPTPVDADIVSNIPPVQQSASADVSVDADIVSNIPPVQQSASASAADYATASIVSNIPAVQQSAAAAVAASADIVSNIPPVQQLAVGELNPTAMIVSHIPPVQQLAFAAVDVSGDIVSTIPPVQQFAVVLARPPAAGALVGPTRVSVLAGVRSTEADLEGPHDDE